MSAVVEELTVGAAPGSVFNALTQQEEIAHWCTDDLSVEPEVGSTAELRFRGGAAVLRLEVTELKADEKVSWVVRQARLASWEGTSISWQLTPVHEGTKVVFTQDGFARVDEEYEETRQAWQYFLASLKSYLETGEGSPDTQDDGGRGTKTIHHVLQIAAPREDVFGSLTTAEGLAAWWTTGVRAEEEAAVGARIDFAFGPFNPHMRITELDPPAHVGWEGAGGHEAWGAYTTIRFDLEAASNGTTVRFWHQLGRELSDDAVAIANFNWGYYLDSLRLLCETGRGKPFQVGTAGGARVGASGVDYRRWAGMKGIHRMTDTEQPSATPAEASADYQKTIRVKASPGALFDALTSVSGLTAWWTPATGSGDAGGELKFLMNSPEPLVIRVDQATRPTSVQWTVTDCPFLPDWIGTRPTFAIIPVDGDESELHFRHHGLTPELDCIEMCTRGWDHFLESLREYVEVGRGMPFGSSADKARRM